MTTIGNDVIPGIQTTVDTADTVAIALGSPTDPALVGPADSTATDYPGANEVEAITTPTDARDLFGKPENSMLTRNIFQALGEGAQPVYACAVEGQNVSDDISGLGSTSGTLANAPASEDVSTYTVTVDSNTKDVTLTLDDPSTKTPGTDEAFVNPVTGDFELDAAPSTSGSIDYTHYNDANYKLAFEAVSDQRGDTVDFLAPVQENVDVTQEALNEVTNMVGFYELAIALCGLPADTTIQSDMSGVVTWDDSRLQVVLPARNNDGESTIGAYAGRRAALGIDASAMGKSLGTQGRMYQRISLQDEKDLVNNNVVPIRSATGGARIVDDPTTVTESNSEEQGMRQGFARLVMDRIIKVVQENETPFIGRLNTQETRNALENLINSELRDLLKSDAIQGYEITVQEKDAMSAKVTVTADTTDPLRNIYNNVLAGQVN
jgi:hypothetical protein